MERKMYFDKKALRNQQKTNGTKLKQKWQKQQRNTWTTPNEEVERKIGMMKNVRKP